MLNEVRFQETCVSGVQLKVSHQSCREWFLKFVTLWKSPSGVISQKWLVKDCSRSLNVFAVDFITCLAQIG